jgi:predicted PurR-regulated permease PerM
MTLQRQLLFWLGGFALLALLLFKLSGVLMPFAAGLAVGYLLDPVVNRLQGLGFNRLGAALLILAVFTIALVLALILLAPVLGHQFATFVDKFPDYVMRVQSLASDSSGSALEKYFGGTVERLGLQGALSTEDIRRWLGEAVAQAMQWFAGFVRSLISGGAALISVFSLIVVTPIVAFYILLDWDRMIAAVDSWLPLSHRDTIRQLARDIDRALAGFVRGQSIVCLILGLWYGLGLALAGLNFGFLIGFSTGVLSFVPYAGSLAGLVLSLCVAIAQGWPSWTLPLLVLGIFAAGQALEGYVLSPKLVGASVGLHPVWMMLALFAFGNLFGLTGLLLAVPAAAAIGVLARFALRRYLASPLYHGEGVPPSPSFGP